jgi:hypothetical protein
MFQSRSRAGSGAKEQNARALAKEFRSRQRAASVRFLALAPKQKGPAAAAVRADTQFAAFGMTAGLGECRDLAGVRPVDPARQLSVPVPEQVSL